MQTKFNIGDTVLIKGTIRRIEIAREGKIYYDVENEGDAIGAYGYNRVQETEIERLEESKEEYIKEIMEIAVKCTTMQSDGYSQIMRICEAMNMKITIRGEDIEMEESKNDSVY